MSISFISSCLVIISLFANGDSAGEYENLNNMAFANNALSMQYLSIAYFGCHLNPYPVFARFDCNGVISPQPVTFSESDFAASGYNRSVFDAINLLARRQYEQLDLVYSLIDDTASIIQPACNYTFSNTTTVADYLNNGLSLSDDMLAFYNDATSSVANQTLQMFAQVLAGAHARKAAYLRILLGNVVSPASGLDPALPISEVSGSISSYLLQCANPPFRSQTIRPYGVAYSPNGTIYTGPRAEAAGSNYTEENRRSDIASLRLLLTFESAQRGMYANLAAGGLSADAMRDAGYNAVTIRPQIDNFIAENLLHVTRLRQMISSLGGDDSECSYSFNLLLTGTLFALRMVFSLSSLNVKANSYVAGLIVDTNIQRQLAMMATIESRHNTLLALLTNEYTGFTFNGYQTSAMPNALDDSSRSESSLRLLLGNVGVIETCAIPTLSSSSSTGQSNNSAISSLSFITSSSNSDFVTSQPEQLRSTGFDIQLSSTSVNSAVAVSEAMLLWTVLSAGIITVFW